MKLKKFIATTLSASILLSPALSSGSTLFAAEPKINSCKDGFLSTGGVTLEQDYWWNYLHTSIDCSKKLTINLDFFKCMVEVTRLLCSGIFVPEQIRGAGYIGNVLFQNSPIAGNIYSRFIERKKSPEHTNEVYSLYDSLFAIYWYIYRAAAYYIMIKEENPIGETGFEQYTNALGGTEKVCSRLKYNLWIAQSLIDCCEQYAEFRDPMKKFFNIVNGFIERNLKPLIDKERLKRLNEDEEKRKKIFVDLMKNNSRFYILSVENSKNNTVINFANLVQVLKCVQSSDQQTSRYVAGVFNEAREINRSILYKEYYNINKRVCVLKSAIDVTDSLKSIMAIQAEEEAQREAAEEAQREAEEEAKRKAEEKAEQERAEIEAKKAAEAEKRRKKGQEKAERDAQNKAEQEKMLEEKRKVYEKIEADENAKKLTEEKIEKEKRKEDHRIPKKTKNQAKTEEILQKKQEAKEESTSVSETSSETESSEETEKQEKFEEKSKDKKEDILEMIKSKFTIEEVPEKNIVKINKSCEEGYDVYCEKSLLEEINNMPDVSKDSVVNYLEVFSKGSFVGKTINDLKTISKRKAVYRKLRSSYDDKIKNLFGDEAVSKFKPHKCNINGTKNFRIVYFVNNDAKQIYVTDNTDHVDKN
ncbi:MAG: hypothetical protein ACI4PR_03420 [Acutalibacteraceae bacterium]